MANPFGPGDDEAIRDSSQALNLTLSPPSVLTLPVLLDEIVAALRHPRDAPWVRSRNALRAEWTATSQVLGPLLRDALGDTLRRCDSAVGTTAVQRPARSAAAAEVEVLSAAARTPVALGAAWRDFVTAASTPTAAPADALTARHQYEAMIGAVGHDVEATRKLLCGTLADDATAIAEARLMTGAACTMPDWRDLRGTQAGLSSRDRLNLADTLARVAPPEGRCVAWIAFKEATLEAFRLPAGHVTFLDAEWVVPNALADDGQDFPERFELRAVRHFLPKSDDLKDVVLARVDLGNRSVAGAIDDAADSAGAIVEAAAVSGDRPGWTPYGWTVLLVDGEPRAASTFVPADEQRMWRTPWRLQRFATGLTRLAPRLGAVVGAAPLPPDLRAALRASADTHDHANPADQVLGYHRVLELVAAHAGQHDPWNVGRLVAGQWAFARWSGDLMTVIQECVQASRWRDSDDNGLMGDLMMHEGEARVTFNFERAADRLRALETAVDEGWLRRRVTYSVGNVDNAETLTSELRRLGAEARLLKERLTRTRDALVHGNPINASVTASVTGFAQFTSSGALAQALEMHIHGRDLMSALTAGHEEGRQRDRAVREGVPLREVWRRNLDSGG